jgi:hypothetical protein
MEAKQKSLQDLIGLMDEQILSRFKPKAKAPAVSPMAAPAALAAEQPKEEGDDPEALRKLADMYAEEKDLDYLPPVPTT